MNYYLSHMEFQVCGINGQITQLVKASNEIEARIAVEKAAIDEHEDNILIFSIRIDDLIIGK